MFGSRLAYSTGLPAVDARDDFARARRAYLTARLGRSLRRRRSLPDQPRTLRDGRRARRAARASRTRVIPLSSIVGTVEPSPHFDAHFRPWSEHPRPRWERVAVARRKGLALPPVQVVEGSDGYYLVDGRHRWRPGSATSRRGSHEDHLRPRAPAFFLAALVREGLSSRRRRQIARPQRPPETLGHLIEPSSVARHNRPA
jgi:hypothetical protein